MFNISFKEDIEKVVLLQVKVMIQIIVKFRAEQILCPFLLCTKHHLEGRKIVSTKTIV